MFPLSVWLVCFVCVAFYVWYFLALLGRKEWKSTRKGKLWIFLQEIWTKDNPNHKIFCFSLEFFLNGLMWGLNDGVVSRGTEWVEANGRSECSPEAHNPIRRPHIIPWKKNSELKHNIEWFRLSCIQSSCTKIRSFPFLVDFHESA